MMFTPVLPSQFKQNKMARKRFCVCSCFYWRNFFVPSVGHVNFKGKTEFVNTYESVLEEKGYSGEKLESVMKDLETEKDRRMLLQKQSLERKTLIERDYHPFNQNIYVLQEKFLSPELLDLVQFCTSPGVTQENLVSKLTPLPAERVYSFPVFTKAFCQDFVEEMAHFEESDLPKGRPNTMNNYGILLNELGFDESFITPLREKYLTPIAKLLYPEWVSDSLDSHKAFVVTYKIGKDEDLSYHYDNAEVTLNVSLGKHFEEGSLYFGPMKMSSSENTVYKECPNKVTNGILHRGQHMHGAMPITEGERYNLIIWMRSSGVRNQLCPMCGDKPDIIDVEGMGDGFTRQTVNVCQVT